MKITHAITVFGLCLTLGGCATHSAQEACPASGLVAPADKLAIFQNMESPKKGEEKVLAFIPTWHGGCKVLPNGDVQAKLVIDFTARRTKLAGDLKSVTLPYFIAAVDREDVIMNRARFRVKMEFDDTGFAKASEEHDITIRAEDATGSKLAMGFELTPEQVRFLRGDDKVESQTKNTKKAGGKKK